MIKHLISSEGRFYKANLHNHSTVSDGEKTPQELKAMYLAQGYSIVAYTDHNRFVTHNELSDENFLALNGVEESADEQTGMRWHDRCCDLNFIALSPETKLHPLQARGAVSGDGEYAPFKAQYCVEDVNRMIRLGRENGFFVTHNHPTWSLEPPEIYMGYAGMHAMEIFNKSSEVDGYNEYNPDIYDAQLRAGKRLFCLATDDNHNRQPGTMHWDSFGGFTMIKAPSLNYEDVTAALLRGDFYASRGPVLNALWLDTSDNTVHLECEGVRRIIATRGGRRLRSVYAEEQGVEAITSAVFSIDPDDDYFRFTLIDEKGMTADTNAYFLKDIGYVPKENDFKE